MNNPKLTTGVLQSIFACGEHGMLPSNPVLQLIAVKKISGSSERFRCAVSDGQYQSSSAIVTSDLGHLFNDESLGVNAVVCLTKYTVNVVQGRKVILIVDVDIVASTKQIGHKIGDPVTLKPVLENETVPVKRPAEPVFEDSKRVKTETNTSTNTLPNVNTLPISELTPYQSKWTIRAKVSSKSPVKTWQNSKGEGRLFTVELSDESGEIRATGFNDAVEKFYELLQENSVYYISRCNLKIANKMYTSVKHEYEMSFNSDSVIQQIFDTNLIKNMPAVHYNFIKIDVLEQVSKDAVVDVLAVVHEVKDLQTITSRANKQFSKREILLVDSSERSVVLNLWNEMATECRFKIGQTVAFKGVKVGEFGGAKNLSQLNSTHIDVNCVLKEANLLSNWYESHGRVAVYSALGGDSTNTNSSNNTKREIKLLAQIEGENIGGSAADFINVIGMITGCKQDTAFYKACPTPNCNKKLNEDSGTFRCEKCNQQFDHYSNRLLLNANVSDLSGNKWVTFFHDVGEKLFENFNADALVELKENNNEQFENAFNQIMFRLFKFRLRVKKEQNLDEIRTRCSCVDVKPVDYVADAKILGEMLKK